MDPMSSHQPIKANKIIESLDKALGQFDEGLRNIVEKFKKSFPLPQPAPVPKSPTYEQPCSEEHRHSFEELRLPKMPKW